MTDETNQQQPVEQQQQEPIFNQQTPTVAETETVETTQEQPIQTDNERVEAEQHGWKSKEQWVAEGRPEHLWKDEKEFNRFGQIYPDLKALQNELKEIREQKRELTETNRKVLEQSVIRARTEYERQLAVAKQVGDVNAVEQATKQLSQFEIQQQLQQQALQNKNQEFINQQEQEFRRNNISWYNPNDIDNPYTQEVQWRARQIQQRFPGISPTDFYAQLEQDMKQSHVELRRQSGVVPRVSSTKSNINKVASVDPNTVALQSLTPEQQAEFKATEQLMREYKLADDKHPYTVKDYINGYNKYSTKVLK